MQSEELKATFDLMAAGYDEQWAKMAPIRNGLHYLLESVFADLPSDARILCVGAGTGSELLHLAEVFPQWRFTAVEPSGGMLEVCRRRADEHGFTPRCSFHEGYVESLPTDDRYDAATCFLVSQFILEREPRIEFFRAIADKLVPGGILASSDLSSDVGSHDYDELLRVWFRMMAAAGTPPEGLERMRAAYSKDVSILAPEVLGPMVEEAGFLRPFQFFQAGLIRAWFAQRVASNTA